MVLFGLFIFAPVVYVIAAGHPVIKIRDSPISLQIAARLNVTGAANLVQVTKALQSSKTVKVAAGIFASDRRIGVPATNAAVLYTANVEVGSPSTSYTLIVDTGSSNTWIGASKQYTPTNSSKSTNETVAVSYGSGFFVSIIYDTVTLGRACIRQSIGVADFSIGFNGLDGILGLGPDDLTNGTLSPNNTKIIPTITDVCYIQSREVGISFEPTNSLSITNGEMSFGGADERKYTGRITYAPLTSTSPANEYFGIDQRITYGRSSLILTHTAGIVDTGTTLVLLASDALKTYQNATGAVFDDETGLLRLTTEQFDNLKSLFFHIGNAVFEFTANAQAWPRSLNGMINGSPDAVYLIINDLGTETGQGLDFVNGYVFLERFYSVFDSRKQRVGFATTPYTYAETN
ncbi:hypothetical protein M422DRAFT_193362 [Sphaerobolus stellatus SS14]|uniref:Peptidase A1 domain-containing protein n=1 Tax=Sphaerobolus stellatus (strain SS14) TaxID=990650 RepID=A0A0C9TUN6_SPHS4|nr:hypothetical protein M422DRAFT_193362 [Sphaerobolus stellatus SS14]